MKPQPTTPTTISAGCLRVAEVVSERGWARKTLCDASGAVCAAMAINIGLPDGDLKRDVILAFCAHLGIRSIPEWNDAPGRTAEEVIAAFRATAWAHAGR